jgi:hypothetical protein
MGRDDLAAALREKYSTPQAALAALGLDSALLGNSKEVSGMTHLSHGSARRIAEALKARGKLALDADPEEVANLLEKENVEPPARDAANAGVPPWLEKGEEEETEEDEDPMFESEEEHREDEVADRRATDLHHRLGREATDDEWETEEHNLEFKPDTAQAVEDRRRADDRRRMRADDARRRLGRDETEFERVEREREEEAQDRRRASDRARMGRDYRRARDMHHRALDRYRSHAADWRRADDARRRADDARHKAEDGKKADDARRHAEDFRRADDAMRRHARDAKSAYDALRHARDARGRARDARRADDRHRADDAGMKGLPKPGGGQMVSKSAMDRAIQVALRDNDARHASIMSAIEAVRPKVGKIAMDSSIQNEGDVYGRALDVLGVPHAGITQLAALRQLYAMAQRPGTDRPSTGNGFAQDSAPPAAAFDTFRKLFGDNAANIERQ